MATWGKEYIKSLDKLLKQSDELVIIGNSKSKVKQLLFDNPKLCVKYGGLEGYYRLIKSNRPIKLSDNNNNNEPCFTHGIIASPVDMLYTHAKILVKMNIKNILIEKPGALFASHLKNLKKEVELNKNISKLFIGYNRRFYPSVQLAKPDYRARYDDNIDKSRVD